MGSHSQQSVRRLVEVDKVADMFADIVAEKGTQLLNLARRRRVPNLVRELVNWAQTFSSQSLPDVLVF